MSYTCPDCDDGILVAKIREIPIADDETAEVVEGRVRISSVGCNNGCSSEVSDDGELCKKVEGCTRPAGHTGRHSNADGWIRMEAGK